MLLAPRKVKYRKTQRGRLKGMATRGNTVAFGDFGLQATDRAILSGRQIEAGRVAMTRFIKRGGKVWVRVFPHTPITKKPQEVKMGKGKGDIQYYAVKILPGTVLYEMAGVPEATARAAMKLASSKLGVSTKFITS